MKNLNLSLSTTLRAVLTAAIVLAAALLLFTEPAEAARPHPHRDVQVCTTAKIRLTGDTCAGNGGVTAHRHDRIHRGDRGRPGGDCRPCDRRYRVVRSPRGPRHLRTVRMLPAPAHRTCRHGNRHAERTWVAGRWERTGPRTSRWVPGHWVLL